jgi:hypothetical protein
MSWSEQALDQLRDALEAGFPDGGDVRALIQWGPLVKDDRSEWLPGYPRWIHVEPDDMRRIAELYERGEVQAAGDALVATFLAAYPLEGIDLPRDVDVFEIELVPSAIS